MSARFPWIVSLAAVVLAATAADSPPPATPSPALLAVNKEGSLAIVDPASISVAATVRTGGGPRETVASTDGKLAFVSNYGGGTTPGNTISVIDLVGRKEVRRVNPGVLHSPHGLAFATNHQNLRRPRRLRAIRPA